MKKQSRFKEHLADTVFIGVAMAFVGGAAGFVTGVGISVILVAIYSNADGRGQPISVVPPVDTALSSHAPRVMSRSHQTDRLGQGYEE